MRDSIVIIAEKPKAAEKIAKALGLRAKSRLHSVPYWRGLMNGEKVLILTAAGHLFSLKPDGRGYPIFKYEWVPRYEVDRSAYHTKKFLATIEKLGKGAKEYINACDYDIEGSVIGYHIIRYLGGLDRAKRAKFSSLTSEELRKAFSNLRELDRLMVEAGLCRHELDWIWGINISRALMDIYRALSGERRILSAGRVQSPTLMEVIKRQIERDTFVPEVTVDIVVHVSAGSEKYKLENKFSPPQTIQEARDIAKRLRNEKQLTVTSVHKEVRKTFPPPPFNLPDLQVEASRVSGMSPSETLRLAESLYLDSLISYPRTNSQKLPKDLNHKDIVLKLSRLKPYAEYCKKLIRREELISRDGRKEDPAHPAIYPTGYLPHKRLSRRQWLIYDLIVRRYLASLSNPLVTERTEYLLKGAGMSFALRGQVILDSGWLGIYRYVKVIEKQLPKLMVGSKIPLESVRIIKKYSRPPPKYTRTSLLKWMESVNIGTEATRAEIIEVLVKRGYLSAGKGLDATDLGWRVAAVLKKFFSEVITVDLTRDFERKLNDVSLGKVSREEVVNEAKSFLEPRLNEVKRMLRDTNSIGKNGRSTSFLGGSGTKCDVCGRNASITRGSLHLCEMHGLAYDRIMDGYNYWSNRLGTDFRTYLKELITLKNTGKYVKDLADYLLRRNNEI